MKKIFYSQDYEFYLCNLNILQAFLKIRKYSISIAELSVNNIDDFSKESKLDGFSSKLKFEFL